MFDFDIFDLMIFAGVLFFIFPVVLPLRYYRFYHEISIQADIETVRKKTDYFHPEFRIGIDHHRLDDEQPDDPNLRRVHTDAGTKVTVKRLSADDANLWHFQVLDDDGKTNLFGEDSWCEMRFDTMADGATRITTSQKLGFTNPFEGWFFFTDYQARYNRALRDAFETNTPMRGVIQLNPVYSAIMFVLSLAALCLLMPPLMATTVMLGLLVHELGHGLALKLMKERILAISFVPFVGGACTGSMPKTAFRQAFFSMGGSLFSSLLCSALAGIMIFAGDPVFTFVDGYPIPENWIAQIITGLFAASVINLFQLIPAGALDGGTTLMALMSGASHRVRATVIGLTTLTVCGLAIAYSNWGLALLIVVLSLPALGFMAMKKEEVPFTPASARSGIGIAGLYAATLAITIGAIGLSVMPVVSMKKAERAAQRAAINVVKRDEPRLVASTDMVHNQSKSLGWSGNVPLRSTFN